MYWNLLLNHVFRFCFGIQFLAKDKKVGYVLEFAFQPAKVLFCFGIRSAKGSIYFWISLFSKKLSSILKFVFQQKVRLCFGIRF